MITWQDAQKLAVGEVIYEEQVRGKLIIFVPALVASVDEDGLRLELPHATLWIPKDSFPFETLYLGD